MSIETALSTLSMQWSAFKEQPTRAGIKLLREASIVDKTFWDLWKADGAALKAAGYQCTKRDGAWFLLQWKEKGGGDTAFTQKAKQELDDYETFVRDSTTYCPELPADLDAALKAVEGKLLPYQVNSSKRLIGAIIEHNAALDASDTGTGKTYSALAAVKALGRRPAILCPLSIKYSWQKVCNHFDLKPLFIDNYEQFKINKCTWGTWHQKKKHKEFKWGHIPSDVILIIDEAHNMKAGLPPSLNAFILKACKDSSIPTIALSATIAQTPLDLRATGYLLGLHNWDNFEDWLKANGCGKPNGVKGSYVYMGKLPGLRKLHMQLFPKRGTRIRIKDLGTQFPPTQVSAEAYNMNDAKEIDKIQDEMWDEIAKLEAKGEGSRANTLAAQMRARQKQELHKVPLFVEMADEAVEEGSAVAIFVNFNQTVTNLLERLQTNCVVWGSNKSIEERMANIEKFQAGYSNVIVCNIASGGVGVSLHADRAESRPRLALISPSYNPVHLKQALGRVHRAGGKPSIQKIVFVANTIEEQICEKVREKIKNIQQVNDGELAEALAF